MIAKVGIELGGTVYQYYCIALATKYTVCVYESFIASTELDNNRACNAFITSVTIICTV